MLRGASGGAAEIVFHLASDADPLAPVTGHSFGGGPTTSDVLLWVPNTGVFTPATVAHIVEKGYGDYALQLTSTESALAGTAVVFAYVTGTSQPMRAFDFITDPSDPAIHSMPFVLTPIDDPIYGVGTGITFSLGEVRIRFNGDLSYSDVVLDQLAELGHNVYAVKLTAAQRVNVNVALVYAVAPSMMPFSAAWDMVTATYVAPLPPVPPILPPGNPFVPLQQPPGVVDHVVAGLSRLVLQFRES